MKNGAEECWKRVVNCAATSKSMVEEEQQCETPISDGSRDTGP